MKNLRKIFVTLMLTAAYFVTISTMSKAATTLKVTGDTLNVRKSPSTDSKVVAMLFKGVECEMLGEEGNWYKIKYKSYTGYVSKDYVKIVNDDTKNETNTENNTTESNTVENNTTVNTTDNTTNTTENTSSSNTSVNETTSSSQESNVVIYKKLKQDADIKILPLIYSSGIENVKKGKNVILLSDTIGWSYIQTDYNCGWIRSDLLENSKEEPASGNNNNDEKTSTEAYQEKTAYISESSVNMRKGAGTSYSILKVLSLNSQLTIIGEEDGWYKVKSGNTTGYVSKEFVSDTKTTTTRGNNTSRTENVESKNDKETDDTKKDSNKSNETTDTTTTQKKEQATTKKNESTIKGTDVVAYAKKYLGYKYVYGGDGSNGTFDCSGFTMYVYKHFGINLAHGANAQYYRSGRGKQITKYSDLEVGDIVFLTDYETGVGIGHCGIYLGNDNFIHASTTCYAVEISSFKTIYKGRFYSGLRLI